MSRKYVGGKLVVYVVLHPDATFSGYMAGADFFSGRGSTSSPEDLARLIEAGCTAEDPDAQAAAVALLAAERAAQAAKAPSAEAQAILERLPGFDPRHRPGRGRP